MINKDRYNFDHRFNQIAEKILTFNGVVPGNIPESNESSKPTNFEQYQMQNDPDYGLLKQGNFYSDPNGFNSNFQNIGSSIINQPISQPTVPYYMQQPLNQFQSNPYQFQQPQYNNNNFYSPQVQGKKKGNIKDFVNSLDEDQLDFMLKQSMKPMKNKVNKQKMQSNQNGEPILINENIDMNGEPNNYEEQIPSKQRMPRNDSAPAINGEMVFQQQRMFEALQQQQFQFQQQLLQQQQEAEMERQRRHIKKQRELELQQTLEPLLKNQELIMQTLVKKVEERRNQQINPPPPPPQNILNEDYFIEELEYRRKLAQQSHKLQLQQLEQEKILQQQNMQLQNMMLPAIMSYGNPLNMNQSQPNFGMNGMQQMMPPHMGGLQPGQINHAPKLKEMQQLLFNKPKSPRSVVVEGILRDMKK